MNKVVLMGRLTAAPELRQIQSGISMCRFTVAVNRKYKNAQGGYDADFINCTAWRQTAEFVAEYFRKGQMICIDGTLRNNNYQDRNHPDVTHYTMDVLVENAEFSGSKPDNSGTQKTGSSGMPAEYEDIISDSDTPF